MLPSLNEGVRDETAHVAGPSSYSNDDHVDRGGYGFKQKYGDKCCSIHDIF